MKTKGLTRGEILLGMEKGHFKAGDKFKNENAKFIIEWDRLLYSDTKKPVECDIMRSTYDLIEEPKFKVDDVLIHPMEGMVTVYKVIGYMVYYHTDTKTDWFNAASTWVGEGKIRHATPEEITGEKQRRFWSKLGREVNEYKVGDIVKFGICSHYLEVTAEQKGGVVGCKFFNEESQMDETCNIAAISLNLVTPVEQRLDMKG